LRSVPAEWSATSPENWDGYLIGRGFDSSTLRQPFRQIADSTDGEVAVPAC